MGSSRPTLPSALAFSCELQVRRKLAVEAEGDVVWDFGAGELLERVGVEHEQERVAFARPRREPSASLRRPSMRGTPDLQISMLTSPFRVGRSSHFRTVVRRTVNMSDRKRQWRWMCLCK